MEIKSSLFNIKVPSFTRENLLLGLEYTRNSLNLLSDLTERNQALVALGRLSGEVSSNVLYKVRDLSVSLIYSKEDGVYSHYYKFDGCNSGIQGVLLGSDVDKALDLIFVRGNFVYFMCCVYRFYGDCRTVYFISYIYEKQGSEFNKLSSDYDKFSIDESNELLKGFEFNAYAERAGCVQYLVKYLLD